MMASTVSFEIEGIDALTAKLDGLDYDMRRKGGRFALRKAANLVRDEVKQRASRIDDPKSAADIAANVAVRWSGRRFKRTGDLMFRVGIMGGANPSNAEKSAGLPGGATQHWRFLEFGTEKMQAQPFMRPALSESIQAATNEFVVQYGKSIDRALKRAAKGAK